MHWFWILLSYLWPFGKAGQVRKTRRAREEAADIEFHSKLQEGFVLGEDLQQAVARMKESREARQRLTKTRESKNPV